MLILYFKNLLFFNTVNVLITAGSYLRGFAFLVKSAGTKFRGIALP